MDLTFTRPFFDWAEHSALGQAISSRTYPFAVIEVFHLFGLTLLLGGVSVMCLRLFGVLMNNEPIPEFSKSLRRWTAIGLITTLASGVGLFAAEGMKCYASTPFWWKMSFLAGALVFHLTIWRKVTRSDRAGLILRMATGLGALILWYGVGVFGRAIGYY